MYKIDLEKLIENAKIDRWQLAVVLFPNSKAPDRVLGRILKGEQLLTETHICRLADYLGVYPGDLFTAPGVERVHLVGTFGRLGIGFIFGPYTIAIDCAAATANIWQGANFIKSLDVDFGSISLREFCDLVDREMGHLGE